MPLGIAGEVADGAQELARVPDNPVRDTGLGPNLQIMQGLSDADRDAYVHALWGDEPRADFVFTLDEEDFSSTDGCTGELVGLHARTGLRVRGEPGRDHRP